jgi:hypothetical protein
MLVDLKEMEIKKLSEIYDMESRESFVSLYMNMEKTNERFVEKRKMACRSVLKENRELLENFDKTMLEIEFVDDNPILQELGGVGGLLRFKI